MIYFHSFRNPGLIIDIVKDIRNLNELSRTAKKAGMIILGGGVCKHQIANAMLIVSHPFLYDFHLDESSPEERRGLLRLHSKSLSFTLTMICFSPFVQNTGQEFDGSDSGARPDEAVSWGKIRAGSESVKVCLGRRHKGCSLRFSKVFADATLVLPLIVAATFAKDGSVMPQV